MQGDSKGVVLACGPNVLSSMVSFVLGFVCCSTCSEKAMRVLGMECVVHVCPGLGEARFGLYFILKGMMPACLCLPDTAIPLAL